MSRFIHNTTFVVAKSHVGEFITWATDVYLKAARDCNRFDSVTMARILTEVAPGTVNFAIQMTSTSLENAKSWHNDVATLLKDDITARLGSNNVLFFSTDMEIIQ